MRRVRVSRVGPSGKPRGWGRADLAVAAGLFLVVAMGLAATCSTVGFTYDEPNYVSASAKAWQWAGMMASGLAHGDVSAARAEVIQRYWAQNHERPGFIKLWWGMWLWVGALFGGLVQSRLGTAILVGLLAAAVYLWMAREEGRGAGALAVLVLLGMPRFFFDAHLAALDAPVAAFCFLGAWLFWSLWRKGSWWTAVVAGLALGCAAGTKGNVLPAGLAIGLWWLMGERRGVAQTLVTALVVAPLWFIVTWPWLWPAPLSRLLEYATFHGKFPLLAAYIFGRMRDPAPAYTAIVMLLATTPVLSLLLGAVSAAKGKQRLWQFLALNFAFHWLYFALPGQPRFNGVRLFEPAFPFLACMAAMGGLWTVKRMAQWLKREQVAKWGMAGLCAIVGLVGLRSLALSHPHEVAFYNMAVGGARGAQRLGLESIYWGSVYLEALPYLNASVPKGGAVFVTPVGCMSLLETYEKAGMLRSDIRILGGPREHLSADVAVFQCQQSEFVEVSWALYRRGRPSFVVEYEDVPLLVAYDRAAVERVFGEGRRS